MLPFPAGCSFPLSSGEPERERSSSISDTAMMEYYSQCIQRRRLFCSSIQDARLHVQTPRVTPVSDECVLGCRMSRM